MPLARLRRLLGAASRLRSALARRWQGALLAPSGMRTLSVLAGLSLLTLTALATQAQQHLQLNQQQLLVTERLKGLQAMLTHRLPAALAFSEGVSSIIAYRGRIDETLFVLLAEGFTREETLIRSVSLIQGSAVVQTYPQWTALGADPTDHAQHAGALAAIRASRSALTVGPLQLRGDGLALVAYTPVFLDARLRPRGRDGYWGAVVVLLDAQQLFDRLQQASARAGLSTAIRTVPQSGEESLLWGDGALFEQPHVASRVSLPGAGEWELAAVPATGWRRWSAPTAALAMLGGLMSGVSGLLVYAILRSRARIRFMAFHDALTQLPNRRQFQEALQEALARARRGEAQGALLLVDLDGFKHINDRLGHPAGDAALCALAARMRHAVPQSDLVARTGGDEFAILLCDVHSLPVAAEVADRLIRQLSQPIQLGEDGSGSVGASIGIALFPQDGTEMVSLLVRTDEALYQVKKNGRNGYAWVGERRTVHSDLSTA